MKIKIDYGNKATVNIGNYENINPMYHASVEIEFNGDYEELFSLHTAKLQSLVDRQLQANIEQIKNPKKPLPHHRIREKNGVKYPSVTTIITPITPLIKDIDKHAEVGTALDETCKLFIPEGEVIYVKNDLEGKWEEIYNECVNNIIPRLRKLDLKSGSFELYNEEYLYSGELDATGTWEGKNCIFDFKKTRKVSKALAEKYFKQMAAYANCYDDFFTYLVIVTPFQDPIVTDKVDHYFKEFLVDRKNYKETYGL